MKKGFMDGNGNFLDRYDAADNAWESGQLDKKIGSLNSDNIVFP